MPGKTAYWTHQDGNGSRPREITQFYDFVFTNMGSFTKGDRIKPIRGQHQGRIAIIRNVGLVKLSVTFEDGRPGMYVSKAHAQVITSEKTTPDTEGIQFARANVVEPDIDELSNHARTSCPSIRLGHENGSRRWSQTGDEYLHRHHPKSCRSNAISLGSCKVYTEYRDSRVYGNRWRS